MVELGHGKGPAAGLVTAMFAYYPVQPPLNTARQLEVFAINRERQPIGKDSFIQPVSDGELDAGGSPFLVGRRRVAFNPVETLRHFASALADVGAYESTAESLEGLDNA